MKDFVVVFALVTLSCAAAPVAPQKPPAACLTRPPPVPPTLHPVGQPTCPKPFEACLTLGDVQALAVWKRLNDEWVTSAWVLCRP